MSVHNVDNGNSGNNNNNNVLEDDDSQWTDAEDEDTTGKEQSSPDPTLPVKQVVRTKRSSLELSQWRADMAAPEHTTNGINNPPSPLLSSAFCAYD